MSKILKDDADRFSSLPDEVGHRIIDKISAVDASRLCVVSKRCRHLYLSTPFFRVDAACVKRSPTKLTQLMNCAERTLCLRSLETIPIFKIYLYNLPGEELAFRAVSWLHRALLCNVREIVFFCHLTETSGLPFSDFKLPSTILSCASLETLNICLYGGICGIIKTPTNLFSSSLKSLSLGSVRIDDSLFQWISLCCKCLHTLKLGSTYGSHNINISRPSLTVLWLHYPHELIHLQVQAEKLQEISLVLLTHVTNNNPKLFIPNIHTIHQLLLTKTNDLYSDLTELRNKSFPDCSHCDKIVSFLRVFCYPLHSLTLFGDTLVKLQDDCALQIKFPNLLEVKLVMTRYNVEIVSLMASFLSGTPNLQHLSIHGDDEADDVNSQSGQNLKLSSFPSLRKLKDVKFVFPYGVQNRKLVLTKYLIKSARPRKIDVIVISTLPLPCHVNTLIKGFDKNANVIVQDSVALLK